MFPHSCLLDTMASYYMHIMITPGYTARRRIMTTHIMHLSDTLLMSHYRKSDPTLLTLDTRIRALRHSLSRQRKFARSRARIVFRRRIRSASSSRSISTTFSPCIIRTVRGRPAGSSSRTHRPSPGLRGMARQDRASEDHLERVKQ